ncbi:MAG: hypothetical protein ACJA1E_001895 [Paracoccaceae bacterium]|jgi:hypothetical protein
MRDVIADKSKLEIGHATDRSGVGKARPGLSVAAKRGFPVSFDWQTPDAGRYAVIPIERFRSTFPERCGPHVVWTHPLNEDGAMISPPEV